MLSFVATSAAVRVAALPSYRPSPEGPPLDVLMLFGFLAAFLTLVLWLHRYQQTKPKIFAFAGCLAMLSLYSFLAGAWPMGIVAMVWCVATARMGFAPKRRVRRTAIFFRRSVALSPVNVDMESRMTRMFGPNRG
jgi:hypothetical protein